MVDQNRTSTEPAYGKVLKAVPVTPSVETERPEGLAFDVEKGTGLPGVPVGDQTPGNPGAGQTEQVVRENRRRRRAGRPRRPRPERARAPRRRGQPTLTSITGSWT